MVLNLGVAIWTSITFFFALHLILGGNLDICGLDDLFFALHLILSENLDICVFFCSSPDAQLHLCVFNDSYYWKWVIWLCQIAKWVAEYKR